jgi:hypothetical protein
MKYIDLLEGQSKEASALTLFLLDCDSYLQDKYLEIIMKHSDEEVPENIIVALQGDRCPCSALSKLFLPNTACTRTAIHVHHFVLDDEHPTYESCECGEIRRR